MVGELVALNKGMRIGIMSRGQQVLEGMPEKARMFVTQWMINQGVHMHMGREYDRWFKQEQGYEYVIRCEGSIPNNEFIVKSEDMRECLSLEGRIQVNDHM